MRKVLPFLLILLLLSFFPARTWAIDEFKTEYDVLYDIQPNGEAVVTQDITITNLKDDVIATNYSLTIKQMQLYDIEVRDQQGIMEIEESIDGDTVTIRAKFNENIIGKDRENKFTVKYKTKDIATKIGGIYNIKIPAVSDLDIVREYDVRLLVPTSFGPNIFITPDPDKYDEEKNKFVYIYKKADLENRGISGSFGKYQVLNYKLTYQLENQSSVSTLQEIALPPDIKQRQQVNHYSLNPEPQKVHQDKDGNLLARYILKPRERMDVVLIGSARIMGEKINPELGGPFSRLPSYLVEDYTKEEKYWQVDNPIVQEIKNKLFDKELNVSMNALQIYNYLVDDFAYDFEAIKKDSLERYGAVKALNKEEPSACMEFTDMFIALARAMGIPARELNGYAVNVFQNENLPLSIRLKSGDLLHSWPEYYDPNYGWVALDPTWGNTSKLDFFTKLDNSHFAFVIKGLSSEYPLPAGLYRIDDEKPLVSVEVAENETEQEFKHFISLYKVPNFNPLKLVTGYRRYIIKNEGGTYVYNLYGEDLLPYGVRTIYLPRDLDILRYEDINGEFKTQSIIYLDENPRKHTIKPLAIIFSLILGLALCSSLYYLLIVRGYLKKLPLPLKLRPRDQDQKRNPRL
jgi:transglutaminase-like putative cysteine protease